MISLQDLFGLSEIRSKLVKGLKLIYEKKTNLLLVSVFGAIIGLGKAFVFDSKEYINVVKFSLTDRSHQERSLNILSNQFGLPKKRSSSLLTSKDLQVLLTSNRLIEESLFTKSDVLNGSMVLTEYLRLNYPDFLQNYSEDSLEYISEDYALDSMINIIQQECLDYIFVTKEEIKNSLVTLTVKYEDEQWALALSKALIERLSSLYFNMYTDGLRENLYALVQKRDSLNARLVNHMQQIAVLNDGNNSLIKTMATVEVQKLERETRLATEEIRRVNWELETQHFAIELESNPILVIQESRFPLQSTANPLKVNSIAFGFLFAGLWFSYYIIKVYLNV